MEMPKPVARKPMSGWAKEQRNDNVAKKKMEVATAAAKTAGCNGDDK